MQPKIIALRLRTSHEAVKKAIQREMESGHSRIVLSHEGGWYRAARNIDRLRSMRSVTRLELHGLKLEGKCHSKNAGHSIIAAAPRKYRKRGTYKDTFEGRIITVTIHEMGLIEVFLEASHAPLDFGLFEKFSYWLYGTFNGLVLDLDWKISELGINADAHEMQVDGLKRMSLRSWRNAWFQIYQKEKDVVRFETHIMPSISLQDGLSIMGQFVDWTERVRRESELPSQSIQNDKPGGYA